MGPAYFSSFITCYSLPLRAIARLNFVHFKQDILFLAPFRLHLLFLLSQTSFLPSPPLTLSDLFEVAKSYSFFNLHLEATSPKRVAIACSPLPSLDWKPHEEVAKGSVEGWGMGLSSQFSLAPSRVSLKVIHWCIYFWAPALAGMMLDVGQKCHVMESLRDAGIRELRIEF